MKTVDMAKENNFVLREAVKAAQMGYFDHLSAGGKRDPAEERWIEALTAGADAITQVAVLESRLAQVERERDAAVAEIKRMEGKAKELFEIEIHDAILRELPYSDYMDFINQVEQICNYQFENEWRGVCEENAKEDADA